MDKKFNYSIREMELDDFGEPTINITKVDIPKVHTKCNHNRPHTRSSKLYLFYFKFYNIYI